MTSINQGSRGSWTTSWGVEREGCSAARRHQRCFTFRTGPEPISEQSEDGRDRKRVLERKRTQWLGRNRRRLATRWAPGHVDWARVRELQLLLLPGPRHAPQDHSGRD